MKLDSFFNPTGTLPALVYPVFLDDKGYWLQDGEDLFIKKFLPIQATEMEDTTIVPVAQATGVSAISGLAVGKDFETILALQDDEARVLYGFCGDMLPLLFTLKMQYSQQGKPSAPHFAKNVERVWNRFCQLHGRHYIDNLLKKNLSGEEKLLCDILHELGVPSHLKGHRFLLDAVLQVAEEPALADKLHEEVYPQIAAHRGTVAAVVNQSILLATEIPWSACGKNVLTQYLGFSIAGHSEAPTSTEFIAALAGYVAAAKQCNA